MAEVIDKELFGNISLKPGGFRAQENLVSVDLDAVDYFAPDPLEVVGDRIEQVHAMKRNGDGPSVAGPGEAGDEVLGQGARIPGVVRIPLPFSGPAVDEIQTVFRRDPEPRAGGQEVGEVSLSSVFESREDRIGLQSAGGAFPDLVQAAFQTDPDGSVPVDVFENKVGR